MGGAHWQPLKSLPEMANASGGERRGGKEEKRGGLGAAGRGDIGEKRGAELWRGKRSEEEKKKRAAGDPPRGKAALPG